MSTKLTEEVREKIIKDYHKGLRQTQLSIKYNLSISSINRAIKDIHVSQKFMKPELKQQIINDHLAGKTYDSLSLKYGLTKQRLYSIINRYTHFLNKKGKQDLTDSEIEQIKNEYENGMTYKAIHDKYNITRHQLNEITSEARSKRTKKPYEQRFNKYYEHLNEVPFTFSHIGLDGQKVYKFIGSIKKRILYIELIELNGEWVYHCENNKGLVCDSRISNRTYDSMINCKVALYESLERKKYFKK